MPLRTRDGEQIGFVKILRDRTAEREAERRFQALTDALPGFVLVTDQKGHNAQVNAEYRNYTGRSVDELLGDKWLEALRPEDWDRAAQAWFRTLEEQRTYLERLRFRGKDGEYRCFDCRAVPQRDDTGTIVQWIGTCVDVENEAQARAAIEHLNRNLEQAVTDRTAALETELSARLRAEAALRQSQKMEAIGQLTGGVAHDFNNLLTIIRSSTDLLRRTELTDEKRRRYIDAISDTADRAAKLTRQLLAFARREALKPVPFDANERIRGVIDLLATSLGGRVKLSTEFLCDPCMVIADPAQFDTAIVNMAVNARDAMGGEGQITIVVRSTDQLPAIRGHRPGEGQFIAVSLSDTGTGIAPGNLTRIFEPFFTTKDVGQGTGLGLSQVFGFAKQSGGEVHVQSETGKGTTFILYLPHAARESVQNEGLRPAAVTGAPAVGKGRILVVEDNDMVGAFAKQLLDELGYQTEWAPGAKAALDIISKRANDFDLVFTDVVMPGMSGLELADEARERWPELPIVLTSGYSHVLAQEGTHGFPLLQKPYSVENLSRIIRRAVGAPSE